MSLEWADGFDTYATAQILRRYPQSVLNYIYGYLDIQSPGYLGIGQCLNTGYNYSDSVYLYVPITARAEYFFGFQFKSDLTHSGGGYIVELMNAAGGVIGSVGWSNPGAVVSSFGASSGAGAILANTWQNIAIHIVINATTGSLEVRVDGVTQIFQTAINTGTVAIAALRFRGDGSGQDYWDNLWVFNTLGSHSNAWPLGTILVPALRPAADGAYAQWQPKTGSVGYTQVNDTVSDDDGSYIRSGVPGQLSSFPVTSLPGGVAQIHGVVATAVNRKDDINPKVLSVLVKSGGTVGLGPAATPGISYESSPYLLGDDPNTAGQWSAAAVNGIEIGVKEVS